MKTYTTLLTERTGPVHKITTNRPEVLNAQSRILLEELDDAFLRAVDDPEVRVIILAGAGKHFSAGHDLGSPQEMEDQKKTPLEPGFKGEYLRLWERFFENTMRWRDLPKPTIAQVQGYCIMGGMMIASACDIIVASEDAQFADRAVKWGGSHVQYFSMPWDFGPRKTKEYLFTGAFISAADAEKAGLVNRVVPRAKLEDEAVRVIILAGAGKHFSAGHDLGSPQEMADQKKTPLEPGFKGEYRRLWERFFENTMRWRDLPKPTIAQVQGYCIMGGLMIASACDLIIASEDAQFADRAVKWGGSHVQYFSMPWDFGPRKTKEYLFTGRFIGAAEAERAGLVNRVVPRAKLEEETMVLAQDIAQRDPYALKLAKASVNETVDAQGFKQAMENAFKNYMLTIPHRIEMGTYGPAAREKAPKDRFAVLNKKAVSS